MYIELYRGSINSWEADHLGHTNVRFYLNKHMEALAIMAPFMSVARSYRPGWASTLLHSDQHIRFIKEVLPGRPVYIVGGVLEVRETSVLIYQEMRHSATDEPAASFRTWLHHVQSESGRPFPWRQKTLDAFEKYKVDPPNSTAPRSVDFARPHAKTSELRLEMAEDLKIPTIGRGCISDKQCDSHGRMLPEHVIGNVATSTPNLLAPWRDKIIAENKRNGGPTNLNSAAMEYRIVYHKWPRAGDIFEIRSGAGPKNGRLNSLNSWMLNPITGKIYATTEAWLITFDIDARKAIDPSPEHLEALENIAPKGLIT